MTNEELNKFKLDIIEKILFGKVCNVSDKKIGIEGKEYREIKILINTQKAYYE
jgi:hypothetical protein